MMGLNWTTNKPVLRSVETPAPRVVMPKVKVRVLRSAFLVDGALPAVGDVVELDEDVASYLDFVGKAKRVLK